LGAAIDSEPTTRADLLHLHPRGLRIYIASPLRTGWRARPRCSTTSSLVARPTQRYRGRRDPPGRRDPDATAWRRGAFEARAWDLGPFRRDRSRSPTPARSPRSTGERYATLDEGEAELARLLAAPAPPGTVRIDDGPLVIWQHVADLGDAAAVERARVAQHAWITSLVEVAPAVHARGAAGGRRWRYHCHVCPCAHRGARRA
jgi:hypothetical protein